MGLDGAMSSSPGGRGGRARTDDVIMPSMTVTFVMTVTCCRSFFETDSYIFFNGPVTEVCDGFAFYTDVCHMP